MVNSGETDLSVDRNTAQGENTKVLHCVHSFIRMLNKGRLSHGRSPVTYGHETKCYCLKENQPFNIANVYLNGFNYESTIVSG